MVALLRLVRPLQICRCCKKNRQNPQVSNSEPATSPFRPRRRGCPLNSMAWSLHICPCLQYVRRAIRSFGLGSWQRAGGLRMQSASVKRRSLLRTPRRQGFAVRPVGGSLHQFGPVPVRHGEPGCARNVPSVVSCLLRRLLLKKNGRGSDCRTRAGSSSLAFGIGTCLRTQRPLTVR